MKIKLSLLLLILLLAACGSGQDPLPTRMVLAERETQVAIERTATIVMQMTLTTSTPTPIPTDTFTPLPTLEFTYTPSLLPSPLPSSTPIPSRTPTLTFTPPDSPTPFPTDTPTPTVTPSPTRVKNPDAVVGEYGASLLTGVGSAEGGSALEPLTALKVLARSADNSYFQVNLISTGIAGWIASDEVVLFSRIDQIPIAGGGTSGDDLIAPQRVTESEVGLGYPYIQYSTAFCGDTYWAGDGQTYAMGDFAFQGRYPRFARPTIRVYVYYSVGVDPEQWEKPIAEVLAQLSQAVQVERVYVDDLLAFTPTVSRQAMLTDNRVDMVWHILDRLTYTQAAPCTNASSCSLYGFSGLVKGGPLRFMGMTYLPNDVTRKRAVLTHAALHALGLWVHSADSADLLNPISTVDRMSARDIQTLRCLYQAPPYGDSVLP